MARTKQIGKIQEVPKTWLSKDEAMAYLGCSADFLQTLRDNALVSFSRFGNKMYWYDLASIDRFLAKNRVV